MSLFFIYWYFLWKSISINDILLPIRFNFEFIQFLKCGKDIRGVESDLWTELSNKKTPKSLSLRCKLVTRNAKHFSLRVPLSLHSFTSFRNASPPQKKNPSHNNFQFIFTPLKLSPKAYRYVSSSCPGTGRGSFCR